MWVTPFLLVYTNKTNWTSSDYINFNDFNRIEIKMAELVDFLNYFQFKTPQLTFVVDRNERSIEYLSSINRIESNLDSIKENFVTPVDWQPKKIWKLGTPYTYQDANRIEGNTKGLFELAVTASRNLQYTGTFSCGEEGVIF